MIAAARLEGGSVWLFRLIHQHGERLRAQNPAGWAPRVKDWYARSLRAVRPFVAAARQGDLDQVLSARDGADVKRLGEIGEKVKAWGAGPPDQF